MPSFTHDGEETCATMSSQTPVVSVPLLSTVVEATVK